MATTQAPGSTAEATNRDTATREQPRRWRWSSEEYYRLAECGFFRGKRVELIDGEIIAMAAMKPPHVQGVDLTADALRAAFGAGYYVRTQAPLDLGRAQPEPDVSVVRGSVRDYIRHPQTALLVVEVSETTLRYDRRRKGHVYARAGFLDYWIVNLIDRQLEIHRLAAPDPARRGRFHYSEISIVPENGSTAPLASPGTFIAVADLLP